MGKKQLDAKESNIMFFSIKKGVCVSQPERSAAAIHPKKVAEEMVGRLNAATFIYFFFYSE